jgi:hypothetical protein
LDRETREIFESREKTRALFPFAVFARFRGFRDPNFFPHSARRSGVKRLP